MELYHDYSVDFNDIVTSSAGFQIFSNLRSLNLRRCFPHGPNAQIWRLLEVLSNVETLSLKDVALQLWMSKFHPFDRLPSLKVLSICGHGSLSLEVLESFLTSMPRGFQKLHLRSTGNRLFFRNGSDSPEHSTALAPYRLQRLVSFSTTLLSRSGRRMVRSNTSWWLFLRDTRTKGNVLSCLLRANVFYIFSATIWFLTESLAREGCQVRLECRFWARGNQLCIFSLKTDNF